MTEVQAKAGDVIFTGGNKIKLTEAPRWSDYHKRYYAFGHRLIKSKGTFSSVSLLHNFLHYEIVEKGD